jgi:D-lactate dehydrogenase (cytochrome)
MVKRAVEMEGTVTGEHGVGLVKRDYLAHELGESTVDAMRRVSLKERRSYHFYNHHQTNMANLL